MTNQETKKRKKNTKNVLPWNKLLTIALKKKEELKKTKQSSDLKRIVRTVTRSIGNMEPGDVEKFLFAVLNFK